VKSNDHVVFTVLDTALNEVVTWTYDMQRPSVKPVVLHRFSLGRAGASVIARSDNTVPVRAAAQMIKAAGHSSGCVLLRRSRVAHPW
jgi:hypothetical protein